MSLPANSQVLPLLRRELILADAHRRELERSNPIINLRRQLDYLATFWSIFHEVFDRERLTTKRVVMTSEGCPSAAARLTSRPSPARYSLFPSNTYSSRNGRIFRTLFAAFFSPATLISASK